MYIKDSKGHDYVNIEVKDGKIISIDVGDFHEGGLLWHANWETSPSSKIKYMQFNVAEKWPNIYEQVRENCPSENLPPLNETKRMLLDRDLKRVNEHIKAKEKELHELVVKRSKIRNEIVEVGK